MSFRLTIVLLAMMIPAGFLPLPRPLSRPLSTANHVTFDVRVSVAGLRNARGILRVSLYDRSNGFPSDPLVARQAIELPLPLTTNTVDFSDLPSGRYAIAIHHDENGNHQMDTALFGIPKEGWGTSNDPRPKLRAPRFDEAAFVLDEDRALVVKMTY